MNAVSYHVPFHTSYFSEPVSQAELDWLAELFHGIYLPMVRFDGPPDLVIVREPGKFVGFKFDQTKLSPERKALNAKATPAEREQSLAHAQKMMQGDYEVVCSNIMHAIKQRRAAGKGPPG